MQAKSVEDKTFGLKNKNKSKKVQQYVQAVKKQADHMVDQRLNGTKQTEEQRRAEEAKKFKIEQARMEKELALIFKQSIKQPPVPPGVDPKSCVQRGCMLHCTIATGTPLHLRICLGRVPHAAP